MRLSDFSVDRPVSITMLVMIVMVVGAMSLSRLGIDLLPDVDFPMLSVMTRYEGASGEDVERLVTRPVEGAVAAVTGVSSIESVSLEDTSVLMVGFDWGTSLDAAAEDMREALGLVDQFLPEEASDPMVLKFSLASLPVIGFGVSGFNGDQLALADYLDNTVVPRLERLEGVAQVLMLGAPEEEVQVLVDRTALDGTGLPLLGVAQGIGAQNLDLPAGRVLDGGNEYLLRTLGAFDDLEDLRGAPVGASPSGQVVRVGDVADIQLTLEEQRNLTRTNGGPSILLMVNKQSGANPLQLTRKVKAEVERIERETEGKVDFNLLIDTGQQVERMVSQVLSSGFVGAMLAVAFMWTFLRSLRPTLVVALAVPLSLMATFIPIYLMGLTLNVMTMGGLMLGIGMLVDNAVVVIENIFRHLEEGEDRLTAAREGAAEVGTAIIASTATTMAVFLPLFFGGGLAGQLVFGLAVVVAFALAASLAVALTMVPMLSSVFFTRASAEAGRKSSWFPPLQAAYTRTLRTALDRRGTVFGVVAGAILLAVAGTALVGTTFLPQGDQEVVMGVLKFPPSTPLEVTDRAVKQVEAIGRGVPGVTTIGVSVGVNEQDRAGALNEMSPNGVHEAQLFFRLSRDRELSQQEVIQRIRADLPEIEGMEVELSDMGGIASGGSGSKPVQIDVLGPNLDELRRIGSDMLDLLAQVPGVVDVNSSMKQTKPEQHLRIDRERAASYGVSTAEIAETIQTASLGTLAGVYRDGTDEYYIRVRYDEDDRDGLGDLRHAMLTTRQGVSIPLSQVAYFEQGYGPIEVRRKDQSRRLTVSANIVGRDLGSTIADIQRALVPVTEALPVEYSLEVGGTYSQMLSAFKQLVQALLLAVLLVYMVMASQFEAFVHPLVIMISVPLAGVGVVGAQLATAQPVSVVTFVGMIMLAGIVVNNGIVLVDQVNQLRRAGMERREAVVRGASTRLRAILITTGTTITALLPLAFFPGRGREIVAGMALAVAGGLATSAALTLFVVPVVYEVLDNWGARGASRMRQAVLGDEAHEAQLTIAAEPVEAEALPEASK
jgi:HAE1 family hydrophobic/amphiphilic exporter-1